LSSLTLELNYNYELDGSNAPSSEMAKLFAEDQRVRNEKTDPNVIAQGDADRRTRTRKLLADGSLHSGKDFEEAAFVFQHGDTPDDILLAHTLSLAAIAKGDSEAIWISAATLDRYLMRTGQKQIYGTQFVNPDQKGWSQEPYDRSLISDALRNALRVPSQAQQQTQLDVIKAGNAAK
jgi:hypothetical protein